MEVFHDILRSAVEQGASDVHIKVGNPVFFRINGDMTSSEFPIPTVEWLDQVFENIIPPHSKSRLEEERGTDFSYLLEGVGRFRTNIYQQRGTFAVAMRYVQSNIPDFEKLGLVPSLKKVAMEPRGIVLVTGSTGSGKSTTLAAMLEYINGESRKHIITLEDPIEFIFEDNQSVIEQREIGLDTPSYSIGMKHMLRQDPDIIMVGEMRDATSFTTAMSAADTGHLVMSTLHTTSASQSIQRILEFFKSDERDQARKQMSTVLRAVVCQRMVQTIDGGVTPAMEVMINTPIIRKLIEDDRIDKLTPSIEAGKEDGMISFNQHLFELVKNGRITKEAALQKASNPQALEMNFQGIFLSSGGIVG